MKNVRSAMAIIFCALALFASHNSCGVEIKEIKEINLQLERGEKIVNAFFRPHKGIPPSFLIHNTVTDNFRVVNCSFRFDVIKCRTEYTIKTSVKTTETRNGKCL